MIYSNSMAVLNKIKSTKTPRHVALDLLARREHARLELYNKLKLRDFAADEINACLDQLEADNLLSDERFTEAYVRMRSRLGFGYQRVKQELNNKGVSSSITEHYLQSVDWSALLAEAYEKKYQAQPIHDLKDKAKRIKFLSYRGYRQDEIYRIIGDE